MQDLKKISAFTLVELLVVISILALLITLVMPGLRNALERSRQVVCAQNMRNIGQYMALYAADNDYRLPGRSIHNQNWRVLYDGRRVNELGQPRTVGGLLAGYGGLEVSSSWQDFNAFKCPAAPQTAVNHYWITSTRLHRYTIGSWQSGPPPATFDSLAPDQLVTPWLTEVDRVVSPSRTDRPPPHGASRNWLFFDGHVLAHESLDLLAVHGYNDLQ